MRFNELHLSFIMRGVKDGTTKHLHNPGEKTISKNFLGSFMPIIVSKGLTQDYLKIVKEKNLEGKRQSLDYIDLPFDNVYIESVSNDLFVQKMRVDGEDTIKTAPVVGTFIYRSEEGLRAIRPTIVGRNYFLQFDDEITSYELEIIKTLNDKNNGFSFCNYNKNNKHTGNTLIKKIVFCDRKVVLQNKNIDMDRKPFIYSHEFDVRGHWRKCNYIGKNPSGEYCVNGATWVNSYKKGHGEYVKKTRVFV